MSFTKIWIHSVWGTKNHEPLLQKEIRHVMFNHIRENAIAKGIKIDFINGYTNHIHVLFLLNADLTVAKTIGLLKGESSFWANKINLTKSKFEWADEYFAVSISESMIDKVRDYIKNQEAHHSKTSFTQEYEHFIKHYNFTNQG
ncbi:MAG: transposase [Bacteroidales bacterium]